MSITLENFKSAQPGDCFIDSEGNSWEVLEKILDEEFPTLLVQLQGCEPEEITFFEYSMPEGRIVDEDFEEIPSLNHPNAQRQTKI
ncbi:MAG: hypothetical protein Athens071412_560 [Parcubacteria group bacterium Athens0714_12]|nr:MAG: hypothetical protein Athens071412_560 [Parcubacteria group bacterium Athens0714_12]